MINTFQYRTERSLTLLNTLIPVMHQCRMSTGWFVLVASEYQTIQMSRLIHRWHWFGRSQYSDGLWFSDHLVEPQWDNKELHIHRIWSSQINILSPICSMCWFYVLCDPIMHLHFHSLCKIHYLSLSLKLWLHHVGHSICSNLQQIDAT
jgi:hypothetical protein